MTHAPDIPAPSSGNRVALSAEERDALLLGGRGSLSVETLRKLSASLGVASGELLAGISWAPGSGRFELA